MVLALVAFSGVAVLPWFTGNQAWRGSTDLLASPSGGSSSGINRTSILTTGTWLNYSVSFDALPDTTYITTSLSTSIEASLDYMVLDTSSSNATINERLAVENLVYQGPPSGRILYYNDTAGVDAIDKDIVAVFSKLGNVSSNYLESNLTLAQSTLEKNLTIDMASGNVSQVSGDPTVAFIVDSNTTTYQSQTQYFGHLRSLLSFYKNMNVLQIDPFNLTSPIISTFNQVSTELVNTSMGARTAIKFTRTLENAYSSLGLAYHGNESLYFDLYTGILVEARLLLDLDDTAFHEPVHLLRVSLDGTSVDMNIERPSSTNEFVSAGVDLLGFIDESPMNDTNASLFFHQVNASGDAVLDSTKYASDAFKILFGYGATGSPVAEDLFFTITSSKLRDTVNKSFYDSLVDGEPSGIKSAADAAWAIIGSSTMGILADSIIADCLDYLEGLQVNATGFSAIAHNSTENETFYAYDNLVTLLALDILISKSQDDNIVNRARNISSNLIMLFTEGNDTFWDDTPSAGQFFYRSIDLSGNPVDDTKDVINVALAIYILVDYYLLDQAKTSYLSNATKLLNRLMETGWNDTVGGVIHEFDTTLAITDPGVYLEDNAMLALALMNLFEATNYKANKDSPSTFKPDFSYMFDALDLWNMMRTHMQQPNGGFVNKVGSTTVDAGALGIVLFLIKKLELNSRSTTATINMDRSDYFYENHTSGRVEITWKHDISREIKDQPSINLHLPIKNAEVHFLHRYPNGSIYDEFYNQTDADGFTSHVFYLPNPPEFGVHSVAVALERAGYETKVLNKEYNVNSSLIIYRVFGTNFNTTQYNVSETETIPSVFPGEPFSMKVNFTNPMPSPLPVTITIEGDMIVQEDNPNMTIATGSYDEKTLNLSVSDDALPGIQNFTFTIYKDGSIFFRRIFIFLVKQTFLIKTVNAPLVLTTGSNRTIAVEIENQNPYLSENLTMYFDSRYLVCGNGSIVAANMSFAPESTITLLLDIWIDASAPSLESYSFSLSVFWRNTTLSNNYSISFSEAINVKEIKLPSSITQNRPMLFSIYLENNEPTTFEITVRIYHVLPNGAKVQVAEFIDNVEPGENRFLHEINFQNVIPWDIGAKDYQVVLEKNGTVIAMHDSMVEVQLSLENAIIGFVVPFAVLGIIALFYLKKKQQLEFLRK